MKSEQVDATVEDIKDRKVLREANTIALAFSVVGYIAACIPLATLPFEWKHFWLLVVATGAFFPQAVYWLKWMRDKLGAVGGCSRAIIYTFVISSLGLILFASMHISSNVFSS